MGHDFLASFIREPVDETTADLDPFHRARVSEPNLDRDERFLQDLAATEAQDRSAVSRDQAAFHLRKGDPRLPEKIGVMDLPPRNRPLPAIRRVIGRPWLPDQGIASQGVPKSVVGPGGTTSRLQPGAGRMNSML